MKQHAFFRIFLCGSLAIAGMTHSQETPIRPAKVVTISETATTVTRTYPAIVLPSREIEMSFKVSGQVIDLPIRAANEVSEGDVIAQIDTRNFKNQIAQLQSQRDQAVAQLDALRSGARAEEVSALEAAVESAQAQVDQTSEALDRAKKLLERGVTTKAQVEAAEAQFRVAEANLRAQQEQLSIGRIGARPQDIAAAEAGLRGIDAQMKVATDNLSDATLKAPFDGIIARRDIENFTNVQAGQSIALLQGLDVVHLAFDIPSSDVTELTRNGPDQISNTVAFDAVPGQVFDAEPVEFSVQADSATQTYRGRVAVTVPEGKVILPGMIASVVSSTAGAAAQVFAPVSALAAGPSGDTFVWLVDDAGKVSQRPVQLGAAQGDSVAVTEGLNAGDTIVSAGVSQIIDGMTIRPITQVGN